VCFKKKKYFVYNLHDFIYLHTVKKKREETGSCGCQKFTMKNMMTIF